MKTLEKSISVGEMKAEQISAYRGIRIAQRLSHKTSVDCGWYKDPKTGEPLLRNDGEMIALMHSELSEALEALRKGLMDDKIPFRNGVEVELADCLHRIFDYAEYRGLDLAGAYIDKGHFNAHRADHKLENRAKKGGKAF